MRHPGAALIALVVAAAAATTPPVAASVRCVPSKVTLERTPRAHTATLRFKAPRGPYAVTVDGRRAGRTRTRALRVRVRPGHRYRLTVRRVGAGRRCRASVRMRVRYLPPSRPGGLAAQLAGARAVLSWRPSRPGDLPLAGYRVIRDGRTMLRLRGTQATIAVARGRSYRVQVRAVDSRRHRSGPASLKVSTRVRPPATPQNLRADTVSQSSVTLRWDAARAGTGRITGYRVFRDGAVLGQPPATSMTVPRLATARAYTFTVAAVNTSGLMSAPSRALTVSTSPPPPTAGTVHAFLLASTTDSFRDFQRHYQRIGTVYPTFFDCNHTTNQIEGRDDPQITQFAKLRQVEVLPRFNCQSAAPVHRILTDAATRQRTIDGLMALVGQYGYDGLNLDIESGPPGDRQAYTSFVADLAARLHAVGKKVTVDVSPKTKDDPAHPRSGIFDYPGLAAGADHVFVMSWGIHWTTSPPGPIADWPWYTQVLAYVKTLPTQARYILGSPLYGIDWPDGGGTAHPGTAYEYADIVSLAARVGATPQWDATAHESHYGYTDASGTPHTVWFLPAQAVLDRLGAVRAQGLGIGVWRLGREDQAIWASL